LKRLLTRIAAVIWLCVPGLSAAGSYDDMLRAIEIDDERGVTELLKRGVDADTVTPKGDSILMVAARSSKPGVVKAILAARPKQPERVRGDGADAGGDQRACRYRPHASR
jgi:uncharacterized protein